MVGVGERAEWEEGVEGLSESQTIVPSGEVVVWCTTASDEVIVVGCDLDWCLDYKNTVFDFDRYRRPEMYALIAETASCERRGQYLTFVTPS